RKSDGIHSEWKCSTWGCLQTLWREGGTTRSDDPWKRKIMNKPYTQRLVYSLESRLESNRLGWLKNGNPSGDPTTSPRCGAKTRAGTACRAPAMWSKRTGRYTRCRMHGGASTGPRTPEGLERSRRAN